MLEPLDLNAITSRQASEGQALEFKRQLDLDDETQRANFVTDVVAFLNAGEGRILIGVKEKAGAFDGFAPILGDADAKALRLLSILQDNIDPRPIRLSVTPVGLEGGFLLQVEVPEHVMRPYQNLLTGGSPLRTGAKNTLMRPNELQAMFVARERYEEDVARLLAAAQARLAQRKIMKSGAVTLDIAILPRAHYERGRPVFHRGHALLKPAPLFHHRNTHFEGCEGGHEAIEIDFHQNGVSRTFLGQDWFMHGQVVHPFSVDNSGRPTLPEFREKLGLYLDDLADLLETEGVGGPYGLQFVLSGLDANEEVRFYFPNTRLVTLSRPAVVERANDPALADAFYQMVLSGSRFG